MGKATRVREEFAGINFSGFSHGSFVTIPRPAMKKIMASGKVAVDCNYKYTDDYAFDASNDQGRRNDVGVEVIVRDLERGKPWLCTYYPEKREVNYCVHSNLSYTVREVA